MAKKALSEHTKEELIQMVCHLKECKKFGLVWEDKPEKVAKDCQEKLPILKEVTSKAIELDKTQPTNIIIEGDNYHALSVLNYTHAGKIDVIYIDPPYNTGNQDFVYNDRFVDSEDCYRHSKWPSFMEKRLQLANTLLSKNGIIFISIDDNEQAYLKVLCDEIFGADNFVSMLVIETGEVFGTKAAHADKTFVKVKDYVIVYAKNKKNIFAKQPLYDGMREVYDPHFNTIIENDLSKQSFIDFIKKHSDILQLFTTNNLEVNAKNINLLMRFNSKFKEWVYNDVSKRLFADAPLSKKIPDEILNSKEVGIPFVFEDKLVCKTRTGSVRMFLSFFDSLKQSDDFVPDYTRCSIRGDLWKNFHFDMRNVQDEGSVDFKNGKKPYRLIYQFLKWFNKPNTIVLDFFAGSGTTGQAVLELNKSDGGKRQFILCTNNENQIAEEVTYPRIKTVITGIRPDASKYSDGIPANVRYFKTDFVSKNKTNDKLRREIAPLCTDMIKIRENCFETVIDTDQLKVLKNARGLTALVFDDGDLSPYIQEIEKLETTAPVFLYVFSYNNDNRDYEIPTNTKHKYKSQPIPEGVLSVYRRIFQPKGN